MTSANRIFVNTGINYARMLVTFFVSLLTTRLLLQTIGVEDFGLYNLIGGILSSVAFINGVLLSVTVRYLTVNHAADAYPLGMIFKISKLLHFFLAGIIFFGVQVVYFVKPGIIHVSSAKDLAAWVVLQSGLIAVMFSVLSSPYEALLNANENMAVWAIMYFLQGILSLAAAFVARYFEHRIEAFSLLMSASVICVYGFKRLYCERRYVECSYQGGINTFLMKEIVKFGAISGIGSVSDVALAAGVPSLFNQKFGTKINAAYGISTQVSSQVENVSNMLMRAVVPQIGKSVGSGNASRAVRLTLSSSKLSFLLMSLIALPLTLATSFVLSHWLKTVPLHAEQFVRILLVIVVFRRLTLGMNDLIDAVGKIRTFRLIQSTVSAMALLMMVVFFGKDWKPEIALVLLFIVDIVMAIVRLMIVKQIIESHLFRQLVINVFLQIPIVLVMVTNTVLMKECATSFSEFIALSLYSGFAISVYFGVVVSSTEEKQYLKQLWKISAEKTLNILRCSG